MKFVTGVLLVEDSPTQAAALTAELEAADFRVTRVAGGLEALARLEDQEFDVVLSDVVMPGMDGYELCRRVKADPRYGQLPVILLTSLTGPLDVVAALESGADNFIRKPPPPGQVVSRLRSAVFNRRERDTGRARMGVQIMFMDRLIDVTADRQQILDLLISTFEDLVETSREMRDRDDQLEAAHAALEQQLHQVDAAYARLQAVVDAVPVPLFVLSPDGHVSHVSDATVTALGVAADELCARGLDEAVEFLDREGRRIAPAALPHNRAVAEGRPASAGAGFDVFVASGGAGPVPVALHASPILDARGRPAGCVGTAQVLGSLSEHDPLTGLPNGAAFSEHAEKALRSSHGGSAVLLLELDRFTQVVHGGVGREVLLEVSRCLRTVFEPPRGEASTSTSFLAHLGGSQFGVVLAGLPGSFEVGRLAEVVRRQVAATVFADHHLHLTASVGVATDDAAQRGPELLGAASAALARARESGGDRVEVFGQAATQDAMSRLELEGDLREAMEAGELHLHFQPQVELRTGRLIGFEALARWQHGRLGAVDPERFISVAEESGLIFSLGRTLLAQACATARSWQDRFGDAQLGIAVNVSARQLRSELVDEVAEILGETGLAPERLTLEVTEAAALHDVDAVQAVLHQLAAQGVRLSLDDVGAGYSSMAYLTRAPFDQLKLDRVFVSGIETSRADVAVTQAIIALGHSLGIPVLAEGVEEPGQVQALRALGCDQAQGYHFARPADAAATEVFLEGVHAHQFLITR